MEQLWAPWRMTYIRRDEDERRLVLCRGEHAFIIMNKYPYTNGHLMVAPYRHTAKLGHLGADEVLEMHRLLGVAHDVLLEAMAPQGFNVGMNLGRIAGAGIEDHLHLHLVPRWSGDTNFMPVFADVRVIPQHLEESYQILRRALAKRR
jgi:ATP adenylyltransferase